MTNDHPITATTLLHAFLDLQGHSPDMREWTEEGFASNPPRLYRLRRLIALFRAFGVPWAPPSFARGEFIQPDDPRYAGALSLVPVEMTEDFPSGALPHQLPNCFDILFRYRRRVEEVLSFGSGVGVASGLYKFAIAKTEELNRIVGNHVAIIDDVLASLICPEATTFTVEELARDFAYPVVDLWQIDAEWW